MKNKHSNFLSQIYEKHLHNGRIIVFTRINNFKLGEIDIASSTFHCVARASKNIYRSLQGLGLNFELLSNYRFEFIVIPFEGKIFTTTREKWLKEGIISPYDNNVVDKQIILPLSEINLSEEEEKIEVEQYEIF
jgi:hypothetical protein